MQAAYGQTSYKEGGTVLFTDLAMTNAGTYGVGGPFVVAIDHISDPTVRMRNADGVTPRGGPYLDFSSFLPGKMLAPFRGQPLIRHVVERARSAVPQEIPIVVATDSADSARRLRSLGAFACIHKPFIWDVLRYRIAIAMDAALRAQTHRHIG